jgi:hypothetical protein
MAYSESKVPSSGATQVSQVTPGISSASSSTGFLGGPGVTYIAPLTTAAPKPITATTATTATGIKNPLSKDTPVQGFTPASSKTQAGKKLTVSILNNPITGTPLFVPPSLNKKAQKSALKPETTKSRIKGMGSRGYENPNTGFD